MNSATNAEPNVRRVGCKLGRVVFHVLVGIGSLALIPFVLALTIGGPLIYYIAKIRSADPELSASSPGGARDVVLRQRMGSALSHIYAEASFLDDTGTFGWKHDEIFFSAIDVDFHEIYVTWRDESHVTFQFPDNAKVEKSLRKVGDVQIEYR